MNPLELRGLFIFYIILKIDTILERGGIEMDTEQLITLQKLGKEHSFSRASKELGVSQPTVTTRIKTLEEELGEILVLRTGQKAILTPAGESFLSFAERALKVYQNGLDRLYSKEKTIAIAAASIVNTYTLPPILKEFSKTYPDIKLRFLTGSTPTIIQMIKDEVADIGLINGGLLDKEVKCHRLYSEELYLVLPSRHALANKRDITFKDIETENLLIFRRNTATFRLIEESFGRLGVKPNITMELGHAMSIKQMILAGVGIGFLPENVVKEEMKAGIVMAVRVENSPVIRDVSVVLKKRTLSNTEERVLKWLHEVLQEQENGVL
jgi:DNA-binding transcriptional LysR family regulator